MDAISFGTDGWRATLDAVTVPRVRAVGQAVATHLADEGRADAAVAVGYDARPSSPAFAEELSRTVAANGFDVYLAERDCPTPLVAWAIEQRELAGGLTVTASHNPPDYNGVKFIPADAAPALPDVTAAIEAGLAEPRVRPEGEWGAIREVDFAESHATHALDIARRYAPGTSNDNASADAPDASGVRTADVESASAGEATLLDGLTVAYDAMHGSGRGVTDALLERAGANVDRLRCDRDREFGGVAPEPSADRLGALIERVAAGPAALGIANDGDADRLAVVTPGRGHLDENLFFAALYDFLLETESGPAVRTVSTTFLIDRIAAASGEETVETPVGFKWVAQAMAERDVLVGGEESGGFSVRGHVREKDGVLLALLAALAESEQPFDDRIDRLFDEHGAIRQSKTSVDCPDAEKGRVLGALEDDLPERIAGEAVAEVVTLDGFKLLLDDGSWVLVRPSGTEPVLRVYAEAGSEARVAELLDAGRALIEPLVDTTEGR
ncbi:phosphoglucomutase [Halobacteriales archaeon QS_4_69_34]|nr:MAG: phosphoglucomutase [Halobacteriales archaeon QS_4_69_34]